MQRAIGSLVVMPAHHNLLAGLVESHFDFRPVLEAELSLGPFNLDRLFGDRDLHGRRHGNRLASNPRHRSVILKAEGTGPISNSRGPKGWRQHTGITRVDSMNLGEDLAADFL